MLLHYMAKRENTKIIVFFTQTLLLVHCQNSTSRCLISSIFLTYDPYSRCCMTLNLVINAFSSGLLGAWFRRKEVESAATVELCCTHKAPHQCAVFWVSSFAR